MEVRGQERHIADILDMSKPVKFVRRDNAGITVNLETKQNGFEVVKGNVVDKIIGTVKRHDSGYSSTSDTEDEDDVIHPCDIDVKRRNEPPVSVYGHDGWSKAQIQVTERRSLLRSFQNFWNVQPRTDTSPLYIKHAQATDDPVLGDRFGASFETKRIDGYYRHIIRHVDVNGVADNMKLNDGDELVLINEGFVPELDHKTILQLFSGVPVDQHTRFTLVLRRPLKDEKWEWVTTSAILVPELEKPPEVRELRLDRDKGNTKLFDHWYRIQIDGTQLFLIISDGEIRVQVASGDLKDYNICVRSKCVVNPLSGDISYYACLFGVHHEEISKNNYLHVNGTGEIGLDREPQWFGYGRKGRKMIFKVQELQKYIGCLVYEESYGTKGHLCIQDDEYDDFNANSIETSYDHPDTGDGYWSRPSSQRSSASEPLSLGLSRTSDTSRSSLSGSNNGSFDDSGYSGYGGGTQCDRPRPFESPISDSGSSQYSSVNSGACRTPNTPMADLSLFTTKRCLENNYK